MSRVQEGREVRRTHALVPPWSCLALAIQRISNSHLEPPYQQEQAKSVERRYRWLDAELAVSSAAQLSLQSSREHDNEVRHERELGYWKRNRYRRTVNTCTQGAFDSLPSRRLTPPQRPDNLLELLRLPLPVVPLVRHRRQLALELLQVTRLPHATPARRERVLATLELDRAEELIGELGGVEAFVHFIIERRRGAAALARRGGARELSGDGGGSTLARRDGRDDVGAVGRRNVSTGREERRKETDRDIVGAVKSMGGIFVFLVPVNLSLACCSVISSSSKAGEVDVLLVTLRAFFASAGAATTATSSAAPNESRRIIAGLMLISARSNDAGWASSTGAQTGDWATRLGAGPS